MEQITDLHYVAAVFLFSKFSEIVRSRSHRLLVLIIDGRRREVLDSIPRNLTCFPQALQRPTQAL